MGVTRRSFIKGSAATAAVTIAGGPLVANSFSEKLSGVTPGPGNKWPGRVVVNFNKKAIALNTNGNPAVDTAEVGKMIDESIMALTGEATVGAAWKALFPASPAITAASTIAIKVPLGCTSTRMAPHWSSVKAIIDGLTKMDFGGSAFPASNITIYEMDCSDNFAKHGYNATNLPGVKILRDTRVSGSTDGAITADGKTKYDYAKSLQASYLINVFRAGGHNADWGEGFTLGFKNHYGTYAPMPIGHGSGASAYKRDINCTGVVFNKNVLSVCIGLYGAKELSGDPTSDRIDYLNYIKTVDESAIDIPEPRTVIMSTDPVSAEMQTIKMMRLNNGKSYAIADLPKYLKASGGVSGALPDKVYNIGVIDESEMEIIKIINGQKVRTGTRNLHASAGGLAAANLRAVSLRGSGSTFIEYSVPHSAIGSVADIEVFTMKGDKVYGIRQQVRGVLNNWSWNEKTTAGQHVANGTYIVQVSAGNLKLSDKLSLLR